MKTRFVLIETSHAGNVGAVARAMRTMGFDDLVLVAPRWPDVLQRQEAIDRASGAVDVLQKAQLADSVQEALQGMHHVCATAMVARDFGPPTHAPREHFQTLLADPDVQCRAGGDEYGVAFLFGSERYGMRNKDVYRCDIALQIDTDADYGSLNLAAAVQVIAYEWRLALQGCRSPARAGSGAAGPQVEAADAPLADARAVAGMLEHWRQALESIGYLDPGAPRKLMPRLQQMFNRAHLSEQEVHILRGIARSMMDVAAGSARHR